MILTSGTSVGETLGAVKLVFSGLLVISLGNGHKGEESDDDLKLDCWFMSMSKM